MCFRIEGHNSYGYAKVESGVHRLVRISPFDSAGRRHTTFASVYVTPAVDEGEFEIPASDIRIETKKGTGPGGQSVNTTGALSLRSLLIGLCR
jgi:peptide chain release factor 2